MLGSSQWLPVKAVVLRRLLAASSKQGLDRASLFGAPPGNSTRLRWGIGGSDVNGLTPVNRFDSSGGWQVLLCWPTCGKLLGSVERWRSTVVRVGRSGSPTSGRAAMSPWVEPFLFSTVRRMQYCQRPVSMRWARSVIRSSSAFESRALGMTWVHSQKGRLNLALLFYARRFRPECSCF